MKQYISVLSSVSSIIQFYYASRQDGYTYEENTCGPIKTTWGKGIQAAAFTTCQVTIVTECNYCQLSGMKHDTVISDKYDL